MTDLGKFNNRETTLDIIDRLSKRPVVESNNVRNHYRMLCPVCNYESRCGRYTTFAIHQDQNQGKCFACGDGGGPREMLNHLSGTAPIEYQAPKITEPSRRAPDGKLSLQGAQLDSLAVAKGLDIPWMVKYLG